MKYDVIVVGSGSGGATVATRLSEDPGRSVLLLEAGPDYPNIDTLPIDLKFNHGTGTDLAVDGPAPAIVAWDDLDAGDAPAGASQPGPTDVVLWLTDELGLARLRARHAEIQARIGERVREPAKLEALRAQAALLDPDAWRTVDEARERLAALDDATGALRKALGRRRRTRRGGARRRRQGDRGEAKVASDNERTGATGGPAPAEPSQPPREKGVDPRDE